MKRICTKGGANLAKSRVPRGLAGINKSGKKMEKRI